MFSQVGPLEIVLIVVVLLIVFGPKRLPSLGRSLGAGIREFKESITGEDKHGDESDAPDEPGRPALGGAQPQPPAQAPAPTVGAGATQGGESAPEQRT